MIFGIKKTDAKLYKYLSKITSLYFFYYLKISENNLVKYHQNEAHPKLQIRQK